MNVYLDQLLLTLQRGKKPLYLVYGDESVLINDAITHIRDYIGYKPHIQRVEPHFDWVLWHIETKKRDLFEPERFLELHLSGTLDSTGARCLTEYAQNPPPGVILLIVSGKLDKKTQNSAWFQAVNTAGITIPVWPIESKRLPAWVKQRMHRYGLIANDAVISFLIHALEGNLLALSQEIEKLSLISLSSSAQPHTLTLETVQNAVSEDPQYDSFQWVDAYLAKDIKQTRRITQQLRYSQTEPALMLWALTQSLHTLARIKFELEQGATFETLCQKEHIFEKRRPFLKGLLQRYSRQHIYQCLRYAERLDRTIKSTTDFDIWELFCRYE